MNCNDNDDPKQGLIDHADSTPEAWRGLIACFGLLLAASWFGFGYSAYAKLMIVVCGAYCVMYFGMPWVMLRMYRTALRKAGATPETPKSGSGFDTFTGWTSNSDAIIQMLTIPAALAFAMVAIAVVNVFMR